MTGLKATPYASTHAQARMDVHASAIIGALWLSSRLQMHNRQRGKRYKDDRVAAGEKKRPRVGPWVRGRQRRRLALLVGLVTSLWESLQLSQSRHIEEGQRREENRNSNAIVGDVINWLMVRKRGGRVDEEEEGRRRKNRSLTSGASDVDHGGPVERNGP
ncbi:hypothetical protein KM043_016354 [Ampulex compressa]|nr:hypothetical protein KM043_016354 [Ampulex compressa]